MMQSKLKIAITGGIGSGKTTVSKIIEGQGFSVISCDEIYGQLLCDKSFLDKLADEFGKDIICEGKLDRKKLSAIVFADKDKLKKLNNLTHPSIMSEALKRMEGEEISFCEVPLLFESGYENLFDKIIVVLRDGSQRMSAVSKRDGIDEKEVKSRIKVQFNYDILDFEKYYVIHNNSDLNELSIKTSKIIDEIINK